MSSASTARTPFAALVTPGVQLLFAQLLPGSAEGALEQAKQLVLGRATPGSSAASSATPTTRSCTGCSASSSRETAAVEALADKLAHRYDDAVARGHDTEADDRAEVELAAARLKVVATDLRSTSPPGSSRSPGRPARRNRHRARPVLAQRPHLHAARSGRLQAIEVGAHFLTAPVSPSRLYT